MKIGVMERINSIITFNTCVNCYSETKERSPFDPLCTSIELFVVA
jgi:hypothetical protein